MSTDTGMEVFRTLARPEREADVGLREAALRAAWEGAAGPRAARSAPPSLRAFT